MAAWTASRHVDSRELIVASCGKSNEDNEIDDEKQEGEEEEDDDDDDDKDGEEQEDESTRRLGGKRHVRITDNMLTLD